MWYSFDYSYAHFISMSTETDFPSSPEGPGTLWGAGPFGDQMSWLEAELKTATLPENRAKRPWVIVVGHRPMYSTCKGEFPPGAKETLRSTIEKLLEQYNVDIFMAAHVHGYERMWPICDGVTEQKSYDNPKCPISIVNGAAGNVEGHETFEDPTDYLAHINSKDYGFARMEVYNSTSIRWLWYRASDNGLDDDVWIHKTH